MHILLVTGPDITLREPYCSGIEAFIVTLANQLVKRGHDIDVIAKDADASALFNVIDLGKGLVRRRSFNKQLRRFAALNKDDYDIIHYNLFIPELYEIVAQTGTPSLLTLHSPADYKRVHTYRALSDARPMTFVAISERIKRQWDRALYTDTTLIHNGIDISQWGAETTTSSGYLLWSARINSEKNVLAAIELAEHLRMPLKIVGRITDQQYFDNIVKPRLTDQIEYLGHITQSRLKAVAQDAKAFLATAQWQEPFGLNTLEMLASGVPVIGFESAIPPDLRDPQVSIAVPSHDWRDLIKPLQAIAAVHRAQCRAFAATMNIEIMALHYTELYENMIIGTEMLPYAAPVELEAI